jgi:hypothetical protein
MKIAHSFLFLIVILLCTACGGSISQAEESYKKEQYEQLKEMISSKNFRFRAVASFPLQTNAVVQASNNLFFGTNNVGSRRVLSGNDATFTIENDSVKGRLAYMGEMRIADYTDDRSGSIIFNNTPYYYELKEDDKSKELELRFKVKNGTEQFDAKLNVFYSKSANLFI